MPAGMYDKGRQAFANALVNWPAADVRVILVDSAQYAVDLATHEFLSSIPAGARVAVTSASLANKTNVNGVLDADDATFTAVSGPTVEALVVYVHTGSDATARLLVYTDSFTVNGGAPPFTPNGGDATVTWDNGANKIFKL